MLKKFKMPSFKKKNSGEKNKIIVFRKKQLAAASLVLFVAVAGYLNIMLQTNTSDESVSVMYNEASKRLGEAQMVAGQNDIPTEKPAEQKASNNYFAQAKIDREIKRDEAVEMLSAVLNSSESTENAVKNAEDEIFCLAEYTQKEVNAENLIKARGFENAVVFISDENVSVAVESEGLSEVEAAVISETVSDAAEVDINCIKIVEIPPEG